LKPYQIVLAGLLVFTSLNGCSLPATQTPPQKDRQGKKVILTTFTVIADMAQNVAGDKAIALYQQSLEIKERIGNVQRKAATLATLMARQGKIFKYKTLKPVAQVARAPQALVLDFNYAQLLITS
jgi:hypothetical protein